MRAIPRLVILLLVSLVLATVAFQAAASAQSTATISGRVTYNGNYIDNATVALVGGSSDTTKSGGYYTLTAVPNIAVTIRATYLDKTLTKTIDVGAAGSTTTVNFDIAPLPTPTAVNVPIGERTVTLVGSVKYQGSPVMGVPVNVSPITSVTTDASGQYRAMVPPKMNLTIKAETAVGSDSKTVLSANDGETMIVNLNLGQATSATATATPVATLTPTASNVTVTATTEATIVATPTEAATAVPATPTPAPKSGSESLVILSIIGILAVAGLKLRKG